MTKFTWAMVVAIMAMTVAGVSLSSSAEANSILDKIFGKEEKPAGPPPEVTLQAPFPTASATEKPDASNKLSDIYDAPAEGTNEKSSINMDQPHRSPEQVADWASGIASQAMTIVPQTWEADFGKLSTNFSPFAAQEYKTYLQGVNLLTTLSGSNMKLQAIADGPAIVMKEGAIGSNYHWLIQIPIMTSFYGTNIQEVDKNANFQSQNLLVQVQVGRITPKDNTDIGLIIERWHVSSAPKQ